MGARRVLGDTKITRFTVANGQAVEALDLVTYHTATITRASDEPWASATGTPSAPTVADAGVDVGSPLTNGATGVKVSAQYPWGEGPLSTAGSATPTLHAALKVTLAALPTNATAWNIYVETSAGSGTYLLWRQVATGAAVIYVDSYGTGAAPAAVTAGALQVTQYNFCLNFAGVSNQRMPTSGPPAIFGTPTRPFGNSEDNIIMVCRGGVYEFDCVAATFAKGSYVGPAKASGNALLNQTVVAVTSPYFAIGKVYEDVLSNASKVQVEIFSRFQTPAPASF